MEMDPLLDDSTLPYPQLHGSPSESPQKSRKRKYSTSTNDLRRPHQPGTTKRACNQCRQQKLKCNVVEEPWADCDRCQKHNLRCEITADFKRVGKRSQQAELERNNHLLAQQVEELTRALAIARDGAAELDLYNNLNRHAIDRDLLGPSRPPSILPEGDDSHDAALLLNLKQGHDLSGARASPAGPHRKLGDQIITADKVQQLWEEFFRNYHVFLPILDPEKDTADHIYDQSPFLFWTVVIIAARHFQEDPSFILRMLPVYKELVKDTICRPPIHHYVVKALCLVCTWPPPVSSTTADMTFTLSGIMMKFAMQLGLHRPSHPMDFSRTKVQLREEDINDRLHTWLVCNIVAQTISTGYGQPPDTVYDVTLNSPLQSNESPKFANLHARLEIEKLADKITRTVYAPKQQLANFGDSYGVKAEIFAQDIEQLHANIDMTARKCIEIILIFSF